MCSKALPAGKRFCYHCGAALSRTGGTVGSSPPHPRPPAPAAATVGTGLPATAPPPPPPPLPPTPVPGASSIAAPAPVRPDLMRIAVAPPMPSRGAGRDIGRARRRAAQAGWGLAVLAVINVAFMIELHRLLVVSSVLAGVFVARWIVLVVQAKRAERANELVVAAADGGRPLWARGGVVVGAAVVALAAASPVWVPRLVERPTVLRASACVAIRDQTARAVECGWRHDGKVVAVAASRDECPVSANRFFSRPTSPPTTVCVDDTK